MNDRLPNQLKDLIDSLGAQELRQLNNYVVDRINLLHNRDVAEKMLQFRPGDKVFFHHAGRHIVGDVVRLNQRTVTVLVGGTHEWRVSPGAVNKFIEIDNRPS